MTGGIDLNLLSRFDIDGDKNLSSSEQAAYDAYAELEKKGYNTR